MSNTFWIEFFHSAEVLLLHYNSYGKHVLTHFSNHQFQNPGTILLFWASKWKALLRLFQRQNGYLTSSVPCHENDRRITTISCLRKLLMSCVMFACLYFVMQWQKIYNHLVSQESQFLVMSDRKSSTISLSQKTPDVRCYVSAQLLG